VPGWFRNLPFRMLLAGRDHGGFGLGSLFARTSGDAGIAGSRRPCYAHVQVEFGGGQNSRGGKVLRRVRSGARARCRAAAPSSRLVIAERHFFVWPHSRQTIERKGGVVTRWEGDVARNSPRRRCLVALDCSSVRSRDPPVRETPRWRRATGPAGHGAREGCRILRGSCFCPPLQSRGACAPERSEQARLQHAAEHGIPI